MALTFKIGTASAAVQIEGDLPQTNWHTWAEKPGNIKDGTTPEPATGHWRRWRADNAL
ncbi:glycoside hydrolase family 1 protein, partial [Staphylococcus hominis]